MLSRSASNSPPCWRWDGDWDCENCIANCWMSGSRNIGSGKGR